MLSWSASSGATASWRAGASAVRSWPGVVPGPSPSAAVMLAAATMPSASFIGESSGARLRSWEATGLRSSSPVLARVPGRAYGEWTFASCELRIGVKKLTLFGNRIASNNATRIVHSSDRQDIDTLWMLPSLPLVKRGYWVCRPNPRKWIRKLYPRKQGESAFLSSLSCALTFAFRRGRSGACSPALPLAPSLRRRNGRGGLAGRCRRTLVMMSCFETRCGLRRGPG